MKEEMTTQKIMELAKNKMITKDFPYLDNFDLMFDVYMEYPNLILLLDDDLKRKLAREFSKKSFKLKEEKPTKKLQESLYYLFPYLNFFPNDYLYLIDSAEYYKKIASINFNVYYMLYQVNHKFKSIEEKLFFELYENDYVFDVDNFINYAKFSSKTLLNSLKRSNFVWYYLYYFSKEAFSDEVADYIIKTKKKELATIDFNNLRSICNSSKLVLAVLEVNPLKLDEFKDDMLSDSLVKDILNSKINLNPFFDSIDLKKSIHSSYVMEIIVAYKGFSYLKNFYGTPNDDLANFLLAKGFHFQDGNNLCLLSNDIILKDLIENDGNLDIVFNYDIFIHNDLIEILIERIKRDKYIIKEYNKNKSIMKNSIFVDFITEYKKNGSLIQGFNKLKTSLNPDEIKIIVREIINNNYYLDLDGIIKNSSSSFYIDLYRKLVSREEVLNFKFNFNLFIKVSEYFSNNLNLLKELYANSSLLDNNIILNLMNAINRNDWVDFNTLKDYNNYLYNSINNSSLNEKDKLYKYMVNATNYEVDDFLERISDIERLTWIQLEFPEDSFEYILCESYLEIIRKLLMVKNNKINSLEELKDFKSYALFDLKVITNNILRLYGIIYSKMNLSKDKLIKQNKIQNINGYNVADITGMDFCLFTHSEEFNDLYDFTDSNPINRGSSSRNYICTTMVNQFDYSRFNDKLMLITFNNPNSLIAFGNMDIYIKYTKPPLISANSYFGNPYETVLLRNSKYNGYVSNEFDFLRVDDNNEEFDSSLHLMEKNPNKTFTYLLFNPIKHEEMMKEKFSNLKNNISSLNYHDLYYLIVCCYKYGLDNEILDSLKERISKLSMKEQLVLNGAITKFKLEKKIIRGVK